MGEARRRAGARVLDVVRRLLRELLALDYHLDVFFVFPSHVVVAPPHGSLVLALQAEMLAGCAHGSSLVAFLASQTASIAACS